MQTVYHRPLSIPPPHLLLVKNRPISRNRKPLVPPNKPINHRRAKHNPKYRPRIIHIVRSDWQVRRERQPNEDEQKKADREDIDGVSPSAEGKRSPGWYFAADLRNEEGGDNLEVGHVEGEVVEGEDSVDGRCRGDVD